MKTGQGKKLPTQLKLFVSKQDMIIEEIRKIDVSKISPLEALNKLDEFKMKLEYDQDE
jgi:DNA mismatch repair protein MutS